MGHQSVSLPIGIHEDILADVHPRVPGAASPQGAGAYTFAKRLPCGPQWNRRFVQVPVSCMFGSENLIAGGSAEKLPNTSPLLNWQCGATSQEKTLIGVSVALTVIYTMVLLLDTIGHECNPRSFSAIAGPSSTTDTFTVLTQIAMAVCFSLMRHSEALWGKLITPVALFLLSVCQTTHSRPLVALTWTN